MAKKMTFGWYHGMKAGLLGLLSCCLLGSCDSLMHDDLPPCETGAYLHFVYDYNIQRADMFNDHVGGLVVFVYDENGKFVTRQEAANSSLVQPLKSHDFAMQLQLQPGKYRFAAFAWQKAYSETLAARGAKFRVEMPQQGEDISRLHATLDRQQGIVENQAMPLDTLWQGLSKGIVEVKSLEMVHDTISLVRDTKELTLSLHQIDAPADISVEDFSFEITCANGTIGHDNSLWEDERLTYKPYFTWDTDFRDEAGNVKERTAHAAMMFSRLVLYPVAQNEQNAMLSIFNKKTGEEVVRINLADCLAQGRGAFDYLNYSPQEFLDREYDYHLDFFLKGGEWQYANLSISVLSWSKRIQRVDF